MRYHIIAKKAAFMLQIVLFVSLSALMVNSLVLSPSQGTHNSQTFQELFEEQVGLGFSSQYNNTLSFTSGGTTYLTVPELTSSTSCAVPGNLVSTYTGSPNSTLYEIRSDLFSEVGVVLSLSNRSVEFDEWYNTEVGMNICDDGLPCWVVIRNGTNFQSPANATNDTAIDGTVRIIKALYIASFNQNFTQANRTKYRTLANDLMARHVRNETITIGANYTPYGNVSHLPMGGANCAQAGLGCSVDMWYGYMGDIIITHQIAYMVTQNETYNNLARNFTAAFLAVSLQNDTDGDGFGVGPFNFNWVANGSIGHAGGGGVNSYHYSAANPQHEDSDAPRWKMVGWAAQLANYSEGVVGPYSSLSTFLQQGHAADGANSTTSCLQYYYNGTCATSIRTGQYENGFGALSAAYDNQSFYIGRVNESLSHWSPYNTGTYDSTSCGTAFSYRGSRSLKAAAFAYTLSPTYFNVTTSGINPVMTNARLERSGDSLKGYATATDANLDEIYYQYKVFKDGIVVDDTSTTFNDNFTRANNNTIGNGWTEDTWGSATTTMSILDNELYGYASGYGGSYIHRLFTGTVHNITVQFNPSNIESYGRMFLTVKFYDENGTLLGSALEYLFNAGGCGTNTTTNVCNPLAVTSQEVFMDLDNLFVTRLTGINKTNIREYNVSLEVSNGIGNIAEGTFDNVSVVYDGQVGPFTQGSEANIVNITGLTIGDNYTLQARAYDGTGYSDWLNSTPHVVNKTVTFRFVDELTGTLFTTANVTLELIANSLSESITTQAGTYNHYFTTAEDVTIRYNATGYPDRFNFISVNDITTQTINLSILNVTAEGSTVTITVNDELGQSVEGAVVKILKYNVTTNTFPLNQIVTTNFEGETQAGLILNDEYYKFIIEYQGATLFTSQATYIYGTSLSFTIILGSSGFEDYFEQSSITGSIQKVNNTYYSFTWNDRNNTATQGCLTTSRVRAGGETILNTTCSSTSSGTVYTSLTNTSGAVYQLIGTVTKGGNDYFIDSELVEYKTVLNDNGFAMFLGFLIGMVFVGIGLYSLTIGALLISAWPLMMSLTGLIAIPLGVSVGFLGLGLVVVFILAVKR